MSNPLILSVPFGSDLGDLAYAVRHQVFVVEQNVPESLERDEYDPTATHIVAIDEGNVVGALRIVFLPQHAKFGRVAVLQESRGRGIATAMMKAAMAIAADRGETRLYLTSQTDKVPLYEKLGFVAYGDEFEEAGIPHRAMKTY